MSRYFLTHHYFFFRMRDMAFTMKAFQDWGRIGGRMRARRLSKARLRKIAMRAARARTRQRKYGRTTYIKKGWPPGRVNGDHAETMFRDGFTLQSIGENFGVSRERIRQILKKRGLVGRDGGAKVRGEKRTKHLALRVAERRAERILRTWGLSIEEYDDIAKQYGSRGQKRSPFNRYSRQQRSARFRKIKWEFTFPEWWKVWQDSGKWLARGVRKENFVMARPGDTGPYRKDNVEIVTASKNIKECREREKTNGTFRGFGVRPPLKTHCSSGHELAGKNLYLSKSGKRGCRACNAIAQKKYRIQQAKRGNGS
jgi:DNA invertase Pin-like site-specific DNA recombinase